MFLAWSRTWVLVPIHMRIENAEHEMWNRFVESDWKYVSATSALSGSELDELRVLFCAGNDLGVRNFIKKKWTNFSQTEVQDYLRFFNEEFMDTSSAYIDENGRLRSFDR